MWAGAVYWNEQQIGDQARLYSGAHEASTKPPPGASLSIEIDNGRLDRVEGIGDLEDLQDVGFRCDAGWTIELRALQDMDFGSEPSGDPLDMDTANVRTDATVGGYHVIEWVFVGG